MTNRFSFWSRYMSASHQAQNWRSAASIGRGTEVGQGKDCRGHSAEGKGHRAEPPSMSFAICTMLYVLPPQQVAGDNLQLQDGLDALEDGEDLGVGHVAGDGVLVRVAPASVQELRLLGDPD